jgi:hypothetical protein
MLCKVIQLLCIMVLLAGCRVVTPPVTKAQYRATLTNKELPMKTRQRIWQQMKKQYPDGCGDE